MPPLDLVSGSHPDQTRWYNDGLGDWFLAWSKPFPTLVGYYYKLSTSPNDAAHQRRGQRHADLHREHRHSRRAAGAGHQLRAPRLGGLGVQRGHGEGDADGAAQHHAAHHHLAQQPHPAHLGRRQRALLQLDQPPGRRELHRLLLRARPLRRHGAASEREQLHLEQAGAVVEHARRHLGVPRGQPRHARGHHQGGVALHGLRGRRTPARATSRAAPTTARPATRRSRASTITVNRGLFSATTAATTGTYTFSNTLPAGTWEITASKTGYQSVTRTVTIAASGSVNENFTLVH